MRRLWLAALALCSCGEAPEPNAPEAAPSKAAATPAPKAEAVSVAPDIPEPEPSSSDAQGAADVARRYYALIGSGDLAEAYELRETGENEASAETFIASFAEFAEYRATVGAPSPVVEADGSSFVEVPVQIYGRKQDGTPFASAGTITLRRQDQGSAEERQWRIYTGR